MMETSYKPKQYEGRLVNFRAVTDQAWQLSMEDDARWAEQVYTMYEGQQVSGYQVVEVEGDHQSMTRWPACKVLAQRCKHIIGIAEGYPELCVEDWSRKGCLSLKAPSGADLINEAAAVITVTPATDEAWMTAGVRTLGGWRELNNNTMLTIDVD